MKNNRKLFMAVFVSLGGISFAGGHIMEMPILVKEPVEIEDVKTPFYIGVGLSDVSVRSEEASLNFFADVTGQDKIGAVTLLAGYVLHPYLGLEGRYSVSFTQEYFVEMTNIGLFLKPQYPLIKEVSVYGLLGYGRVNLDSVAHSNINGDKAGFQWGLGAAYNATDAISLFGEYSSLATDVDTDAVNKDVDAFTLGLSYRL